MRCARRGALLGAVAVLAGCGRGGAAGADAGADAAPPWAAAQEAEPEPRPGMAYVPAGVLIAGTPPDRLPRVADEEMAGEQVVLHGFYIDLYPYPNEPGAIPTTNLTQSEARALCEQQGKRLCTELEWERACKGPDNTTYEYGDTYKAAVCGTGTARALTPAGLHPGCASAFGVHDLHGSVATWTSSQWRRDPAKTGLVTLRGGPGTPGELVGRCASGRAAKPEARREDVGVRCCAGEPNGFEVVLNVKRGAPLTLLRESKLAAELERLVPDDLRAATAGRRAEDQFKVERTWIWHPLGNEELALGGGCAHPEGHAACGVLVARLRLDAPTLLAFVSSEWWQPTIAEADGAREIFLHGGDDHGAFRKKVSYEWGKIGVRDKERKKKLKGRKEPAYE
jgi:formylglycine-generating enzyme required for sulfatase activity